MTRDLISGCALGKKLRSPVTSKKMTDLPSDRLEEVPPFANSGLYVFGNFLVNDGVNTKQTCATKQICVVIFMSLSSRAIPLEMLSLFVTIFFLMHKFCFCPLRVRV